MKLPDSAAYPVLLDEVVDGLSPVPGERHVDCTFGAGGYTNAILEGGVPGSRLRSRPRAIEEGGQPIISHADGRRS